MRKSNLMKSFLIFFTFLIFFSHFFTIGYSNEVGIQNGMYVKHIHSFSLLIEEIPTTLTFSTTSGDTIHITWKWGGSVDDTGSWDVNISTRIVLNYETFGPEIGTHDWAWIYTDVSLNDQITVYNMYKEFHTGNGDAVFNITGESMYDSREVWELEDAYGSVLWYDKAKGFLVNGTTRYGLSWEEFEFVETGSTNQGISGYGYFLLFGAIFGFGVTLIKYKSRK